MSEKDTLELLEKSGILADARQKAEQSMAKERKATAKRLQAIEAEADDDLVAELELAEHDAVQARQLAAAKTSEAAELKRRLGSRRLERATRAGKLRAELVSTAPAEIDKAIAWFRTKETELMRTGTIKRAVVEAKRSPFTDKLTSIVRTNYRTVVAALEVCREAVKELEALKTDPAADHASVIKSLEAGIPDVESTDAFHEIEASQP